MKCFFKGAAGAVLLLVLIALLLPLYSNYGARAETAEWLVQLAPVQRAVEAKSPVIPPAFVGSNVTFFRVNPDGVITLKGGSHGQMVVLSPISKAGKIEWDCIGGPSEDMPIQCRK
ncbi:MAG TPA: pilin [Telluria sp.]|jgi:hypothetical protein